MITLYIILVKKCTTKYRAELLYGKKCKKWANEPFGVRKFFARTNRTHCLSERFGRTEPNRPRMLVECTNPILILVQAVLTGPIGLI